MIRIKLILFSILLFGASPVTAWYYMPLYKISESELIIKAWDNWYYTMLLGSSLVLLNILRGLLSKETLIIDICTALVIGAIIDTLFFDINYYQLNDLLTITIAFFVWLFKYLYERQRR